MATETRGWQWQKCVDDIKSKMSCGCPKSNLLQCVCCTMLWLRFVLFVYLLEDMECLWLTNAAKNPKKTLKTYLKCKDIIPDRIECIFWHHFCLLLSTIHRNTNHFHLHLYIGWVILAHILSWYNLEESITIQWWW